MLAPCRTQPPTSAGPGWPGPVLLIIATLVVSRWQKLGLEQRLLIGCVRTTVQLILIGYVLHWIIHGQDWRVILLTIAVQLALAAWTAGGLQQPPLPGARLIALVSIGPAYLLVITVLLALVVQPAAVVQPARAAARWAGCCSATR